MHKLLEIAMPVAAAPWAFVLWLCRSFARHCIYIYTPPANGGTRPRLILKSIKINVMFMATLSLYDNVPDA